MRERDTDQQRPWTETGHVDRERRRQEMLMFSIKKDKKWRNKGNKKYEIRRSKQQKKVAKDERNFYN